MRIPEVDEILIRVAATILALVAYIVMGMCYGIGFLLAVYLYALLKVN